MTGRDEKARREERARRTIQELHENFARAAPGRALVEQLYAKHEKELEKIGEAQTMAWAMEEARQRFTLTARDREAIKAYEADCRRSGTAPTEDGRRAWVREWRELDEEHRLAGLEAQWEDDRRYSGFEP